MFDANQLKKFWRRGGIPQIKWRKNLGGPRNSFSGCPHKPFVDFGFEGGQHDDVASIDNHVAFIYLNIL